MNSLPKTVTRQRRDCDLNPGPSAPESSTLTTRLPSHPHAACSRFKPLFYLYTVKQKKDQFSLVCILFSTRKKLVNVFTYIRPRESGSISYNSVYLILAYVDNFAVTETLNIFYRAMLCIRGTSHGPVSVCLSVCPCPCPSVCHKSEFY